MTTPTMTLVGSHNFLIRPYAGVEALHKVLDITELVIGENRYLPGSVSLPNTQFPIDSATLEVYWDLDAITQHLSDAEIPLDDVKLACVIYGSVIAQSQVIENLSIAKVTSPVIISVKGEPFITSSPNGFDLRVFLYVARDAPSEAWRPNIAGTWLAFKEFRIAPQFALSRFSPTPLDDAIRHHYGLPAETLSYVRVGESILDVDSLDEDLDVFVDVTILRLLQENPNSALSKYIQLDLAIATLWSLVIKVANLSKLSGSTSSDISTNVEGSAAWGLCRELARSVNISVEDLLASAQDEPGMVRSFIEVYVHSLKTTSLALREVS